MPVPFSCSPQPFTGPPSWIPQMMSSGKPELGIMNAAEAYQAFTGDATPKPLPQGITVQLSYDRRWSGLRALLLGTDISVGMLVRKNAKYQALPDIKAARISWGYKGQPANQLQNLANLALGGVAPKDVQQVEVPSARLACMLWSRGGWMLHVAFPWVLQAAIEADARVGVRFLDGPPDPTSSNRPGIWRGQC